MKGTNKPEIKLSQGSNFSELIKLEANKAIPPTANTPAG
jgi:hypothetical protein